MHSSSSLFFPSSSSRRRRRLRRRRLRRRATTLLAAAALFLLSASSSSFFGVVSSVEGVKNGEEGDDATVSFRSFKTARDHHHHRGDDAFARGGGGGGGGGRGSSSSSARDDDRTLVDASAKTHGEGCGFPCGTRSSIQHHRHHHEKDKREEGRCRRRRVGQIGFISGTSSCTRKGADVADEKFRVKNLKVHRDELDARAKRALQALAKRDGMYRVRVPSNIYASQDSGRSSFAQAASPAKCVVTSRLRESFTLHMDDNGNVLAVDYEAECPVDVHLGGADEERNAAEEEKEGASLFIADGAQFRSVATARFPKRAPQLTRMRR